MWKYEGDGQYIIGRNGRAVPPRDLTDEEHRRYWDDIRAHRKNTGIDLYRKLEGPTAEEKRLAKLQAEEPAAVESVEPVEPSEPVEEDQ